MIASMLRGARGAGSFLYKTASAINKTVIKGLDFIADAYDAQEAARKYDAIADEAKADGVSPKMYALGKYLEKLVETREKIRETLNRDGSAWRQRRDDFRNAENPEAARRALFSRLSEPVINASYTAR